MAVVEGLSRTPSWLRGHLPVHAHRLVMQTYPNYNRAHVHMPIGCMSRPGTMGQGGADGCDVERERSAELDQLVKLHTSFRSRSQYNTLHTGRSGQRGSSMLLVSLPRVIPAKHRRPTSFPRDRGMETSTRRSPARRFVSQVAPDQDGVIVVEVTVRHHDRACLPCLELCQASGSSGRLYRQRM